MVDNEKESGAEGPQEEEHHEPTPPDEETAPGEDISEEECDETINGLLTELESQRSEIAQLREWIARHDAEYEHTRRPGPGSAVDDGSPDERHWYFRKFGN